MRSTHVCGLALLAVLTVPPLAAAQNMSVQLLFDGKPLRTTAPPQFSCLDRNRNAWVNCQIGTEPGPDGYVMVRPAPGNYTLHVEIDENSNNPGRFPGDYDVFHAFTVTADAPAILRVDVPKLMRLRLPWDTDKDLDGMLTLPWTEKPAFETPRRARPRMATVTFKWDAVARGAEYSYTIVSTRDTPYERGPDVIRGKTAETSMTIRLPPSGAGRYFEFGLSAHRDGRQVGDLMTHDAGVQGWTTRFVVNDWSGQRKPETAARASRRKRDDKQSNAAFLAEWRQAVPKPAWWDSVPSSKLAIRSYGDLMALWQSGTNDEPRRRLFHKLTYQAILDHPGDEQLVPMGINLMAYTADSDARLPLLKFGVDHFFSHDQRTDDCANCKVGDRTADMVSELAGAYTSRGEPEAAIALIRRLVNEREADISDYKLALTLEVMSRAYWNLKDRNGARAAIQEGLRHFPNGWQADQLRRTLDRYEKARPEPPEPR